MRSAWLSLGLVALWALVGWTQCSEIPYTVGGTTVTLRFCGNLVVSGGTCSQVASNVVQCSVPEGTTGTVNLSAQRTPAGTVSIGTTLLPGWASFTSVSGWGSVSGQCRFTVPTGTAGQRFELKFQASASGVPSTINLTVILNIVRVEPPPPPEPQIYGPYTGTTDDDGRFTVPIPDLPNNVRVGGTLTECTVRTLTRTPVTIYVATTAPVAPPSFGMAGLVWASYPVTPVAQQASGIAYILISVPGYPLVKVSQFRVIPIIVGGMTYTMVDLGTVSFPSPACQTQPRDGAITGRTDGEGKFTVNVGSGTTVSGRLTECTVKPLPNQTFSVTPVFSEGDLSVVRFVVPGYADTTVTKALSVFHLGAATYVNLGDVCLTLAAKPDLRLENLCLVSAPAGAGRTFYDVYPWRLGELDERLHPESPTPSPLPTRYLVAVQLDVVNDGDGPVRELPVVELVVLDSGGREVSHNALAVIVVKADMPQRWRAEGVILVDLKGAVPTSLPTFRLIADPGNKIAEKDETNNTEERRCDPAYRQKEDPRIHAESGVLEKRDDGSWVVGKDRPLNVSAEAFLDKPLPLPIPTGTGLPERWRTEVLCYPRCPLAIQYEWDFGDGTKKTGKSVSHTYARNGQYTITLATVLGDDRRTATQEVEVTDKPVVTLRSQYTRVFVQRVPVSNWFTASVDANGNTLQQVEWILNGRLVEKTPYNTDQPIIDTWTYDLGALQAHPLRNQVVVRAVARAKDGRMVVGEAALEVPVAAVPSWLEWTLDIRAGQVPLRAHPRDAWVLYETSYVFPYPPIDITFKMPEGVPFFGGKYKFGAKADFSLDLNSLSGTGNVGGEGEVRFEKGGGEWTFGFEGKVTGKATLANIPPINLVAGEFSFSLEGSFSKDLTVSDVPVIGPKVRAAKAIPLIGSAIKWLENRAKVQFGFSVGIGGDVSFTSGEPGRCIAGIDCSGKVSLSGGLGLALEVDLEVLKVTPYGGAKLTVSFAAPGETIGFLDFDSLTLTGTLGISVVVDLWFCEVEKDFSVDFSWRILSPAQGFVTDHETPWTLPVRPYATPGYSTFRGEARAVPELGVTELWLVEEVFPHARPALVRDPALAMVIWTTDDLAKPFPLGREIAYSSSPSVAVMARPRLITNNQLPDSQAVFALDWIGNPVAVWVQHVSPPSRVPETEQDLTPELLAGLEVVYACYDWRTASWGTPTCLTNNAFLEHSPRFLYDARGITGIIWTANTQGELYPEASAPDTLYLARWDGQAFSAPEMLREGDTSLMRAFADLGGRILYVWVEDRDGDWGTQGDEELLWSVWDGTRWTPPERLTTNSVDDEWPVLFPTGMGRADLFWVRIEPGAEGREGVLLVRSFGPDGWTDDRVLLEGRPIFSFHAARSRDGQVAVVWQEISEQGPDLFSIVCQPGGAECTEPRQLTADPHQESQVSLVFDDGLLTMAFLRTMVEEQTKKVRYTGPNLEDPTIQYTEEEFEITVPTTGATHLYLLEVRMP